MLYAQGGGDFSRPSVPSPCLPMDFGSFVAVPRAVPGWRGSRPRRVERPRGKAGGSDKVISDQWSVISGQGGQSVKGPGRGGNVPGRPGRPGRPGENLDF